MKTIYTEVLARFTLLGEVVPLTVIWHDGRRFDVSRVLDHCNAPPTAASTCPVRYDCMISGERRSLYFEPENMRWYVVRTSV